MKTYICLLSIVLSTACADGPMIIENPGPFSRGDVYLTVDRLLELYGYPTAMNGYTMTVVGRDTYLNNSLDSRGLTLVDCCPVGDDKRMLIRSGYFAADASYQNFSCFAATEIYHEVAHAVLVHTGVHAPCNWREYTLEDLHPDAWFGPRGTARIARDKTIAEFCPIYP